MPTPKRKPGRPSTYSPEIGKRICERITTLDPLTGTVRSTRDVCREEGMPHEGTVCAWAQKNAEFGQMYAQARARRADMLADEVIGIADAEGDPQRAKVMIDARKWWAGKISPKAWADKPDTNMIAINNSGPSMDETELGRRILDLLDDMLKRRDSVALTVVE